MIKLCMCVKRLPEISRDEFLDYWRNHHAKLVTELREDLGIARYAQTVLLPDDAATADACLLQGRSIMEGAPASALGKAMSALVDRIDPQIAAVRKARSSSRPLLRRLKRLKRRGREQRRTTGSAGRATAAGGRSRRGVRAQRGRRRKGDRAVTSGAESRAPERPVYSTRQSQTAVPPSTPPPVQPPSPPQAMRDGPTPWPGAGPAPFGERG